LLKDIHSALLGKLDVRDDKAEIIFLDQLKCLGSRVRGFNLVPLLLEHYREKIKEALLIVDNEYIIRFSLLFL
jgi:hypothetical protein